MHGPREAGPAGRNRTCSSSWLGLVPVKRCRGGAWRCAEWEAVCAEASPEESSRQAWERELQLPQKEFSWCFLVLELYQSGLSGLLTCGLPADLLTAWHREAEVPRS